VLHSSRALPMLRALPWQTSPCTPGVRGLMSTLAYPHATSHKPKPKPCSWSKGPPQPRTSSTQEPESCRPARKLYKNDTHRTRNKTTSQRYVGRRTGLGSCQRRCRLFLVVRQAAGKWCRSPPKSQVKSRFVGCNCNERGNYPVVRRPVQMSMDIETPA
jgi:hypothetical protein